ncbi:histone H4 transcription factor [Procambarus clarkii]|uniref:histone H4 transcription factor n=1 Tax=Procambarus clarkii TaxID=6728 RepID=UPI001E672D1F|nr:histone H4 transcription factor-like [Procambarus clarkii]XP_045621241.1 histone H4 transcription factor-like [Procambarus clarkii]XP_045621242.1 histone H4 transcription factor-like [Procambarus clarkii]
MTLKRKLCEMNDVDWDRTEEAGSNISLQSSMDTEGSPYYAMENSQEEAIDDPAANSVGDQSTTETSESAEPKKKPTKKKKISAAMVQQQMSLNCEWNMCSAVYKKMEQFVSHVADHLAAETGPPSGDGYLCHWRECWFACSTKEERYRHVYFHAFHAKVKSIGAVLMEERHKECILDSSGRNMVPEIPEPFQCMWEDCVLRFVSAQDFYWHVLGHVRCTDPTTSTKAFVCSWEGCTATFRHKIRLGDHTRSHTQEKIVGCPNCGGIYASNTKFFDHCIRQLPLDSQQFQCSLCSRRYANERLLRDHVRHHINLYKCGECDMSCPNKSALAAHTRYRHAKEKPFKCTQCGRGFTLIADLTRHLTVHSEEPAYVCPYNECDYKCRSSTTLNRHIKMVHNGLRKDHYACHMCNLKFKMGELLTKHLIKEHGFLSPAAHTRFRYKQDDDGFYRLQTVRYETIEQTQEMLNEEGEDNLQEKEEEPPHPLPPPQNSKSSWHPHKSARRESTCDEEWEKQDLNQLLKLKTQKSVKTVEYQEIILPSEF